MSKLHEMQKDPVDSNTPTVLRPVDKYNLYARQEGHRVLTEEEYNKLMAQRNYKTKNATSNTGESNKGILGEGKGSVS